MKSCMINGDMSSDRAGDQYPTVAVCDECAEANSEGEDAAIISVSPYDPSDGDECYFCDLSAEDEAAQK